MRRAWVLALCVIASPAFAPPAFAKPVHQFLDVRLSPDGKTIASVEGDQPDDGGAPVLLDLVLRHIDGSAVATIALPCGRVPECTPASPAFAPDGRLAFTLRHPGSHGRAVYSVGADGTGLTKLLDFDGTVQDLKFGPHGEFAMLATADATKEVGAGEAGAGLGGVLGQRPPEQRLALIEDGKPRWITPDDLFVYQYDWRPDGSGFVGTAAPGDGDNNWWIAKLYAFPIAGAPSVLYAPTDPARQIADPKVSPDGKSVAFIGGLMSDFGSTGGDIFVQSLEGGAPRDRGVRDASAVSFAWGCDGALEIALLRSPTLTIAAGDAIKYSGSETIGSAAFSTARNEAFDRACPSGETATVRQDFTHPPEIVAGPVGQWKPITHANDGLTAPAKAQSITWTTDAGQVQGWVVSPDPPPPGKHPLITVAHGGPAAAYEPRFIGSGLARDLLAAGYALFLPNPRGSFGAGEDFTRANIRDLGHGDLRDILAGIDAVAKTTPLDEARLGITGGSYGGFMTMWAVTQTDRFKAGAAVAGISDWTSYYGENGIDRWMIPYFGASVYDDPEVYARSSPITFIKRIRTPTLAIVGAEDLECPAPQTQEFWHALNALGVPTEAVIYPGEGHWFRDPKTIGDERRRILAWFGDHLR